MARRRGMSPQLPVGTMSGRGAFPRFFAFGNVAYGFIAVGNVAFGVVAIGLSLAVGPVAIGINAVGFLLALGINALGSTALAAVNGAGVISIAGVNSLGAYARGFVNSGGSLVFAGLALIAQIVTVIVLRPRPAADEAPALRLADLLRGTVNEGRIEVVQIPGAAPDEVKVSDPSDGAIATLSLSGGPDGHLATLLRLHAAQAERVAVWVRASDEAQQGDDYRHAPERKRVLYVERAEALPPPPPFWARPGLFRQVSRASLLAGACISIGTLIGGLLGP